MVTYHYLSVYILHFIFASFCLRFLVIGGHFNKDECVGVTRGIERVWRALMLVNKGQRSQLTHNVVTVKETNIAVKAIWPCLNSSTQLKTKRKVEV